MRRLFFLVPIICFACNPKIADKLPLDDGLIEIAIVQINDVYEISGVSGGTKGNLSRVAGYYKGIQKQYPNSMLMLAGDFLNPSLINSMKYEGERIKGRQMIDVLNTIDLDLACFGNHEFDLDESELQSRMDESEFQWISTNLEHKQGDTVKPFYKSNNGKKEYAAKTFSKTFVDTDGTSVNIGVFSATLNSNPKPYVQYYDADSCADLAIKALEVDNEIIIGLTHLDIVDDLALAERAPDVDLILGGHDHDNMIYNVGPTVVSKADANAKTVYLHVLKYDTRTDNLMITSSLVEMNASIKKDPITQAAVVKWNRILEDNIKQVLPDPYRVVYKAVEPLDGRESTIRHKQTKLGSMITESMIVSSKRGAVAGILNSGSVRIDDQLSGNITGIDVFRILPFGGSVFDVEMKGSLLKEVLTYSDNHKGKGAYLQLSGITNNQGRWFVGGEKLDVGANYNIALNDFLLMGYDIPFLTKSHEGIINVNEPATDADLRTDIRLALIRYLEQ